jgi:hypothetical protein
MKILALPAFSWLILFFLSSLLTSCLFFEGDVIDETKDVVVTDSNARFVVWERCSFIDVTDPT